MTVLSRLGWKLIRGTLIGWERLKGHETAFSDPAGPITSFSWGCFVINGEVHRGGEIPTGVGADVRMIDGRVEAWTERQGHLLRFEMVAGILDEGVDTLVLGLGVCNALRCPPELIDFMQRRGIADIRCLRTPAACAAFNELSRQGRRVALLAHGTC